MARNVSLKGVLNYRIACQPSHSKQPLCGALGNYLETKNVSSFFMVDFEHHCT